MSSLQYVVALCLNFAIKTPLSHGKRKCTVLLQEEYVNFITSPKNVAIFIAFLISLDKTKLLSFI